MQAPIPIPFALGAALNSVLAVAVPLIGTAFPATSIDTPLAVMNTGAFAVTTLRITCVPTGSEMPLLPLTGTTVVVVNLSPSALPLLHTRDPLASSSVVPGPMDPVFATGAGGGGGAGAGAAGGGAVTGPACEEVAGAGTGAAAGAEEGAARDVRGAGSGARFSGALRRAERWAEVGAAPLAAATAGAGVVVSGFEWKMPNWLRPVTAAVIDPTSAAVAVRYPGAV